MKYQYDAELIEAIPSFTIFDLTNPQETREKLLAASKNRPTPDATGVEISDHEVLGLEGKHIILARVYRPVGVTEDLPVVLNIHGGGFVIGRVEVDQAKCIDIARRVAAVVVSVGYRLAPEHPYPAALEDCYAVLQWIGKSANELGGDISRIAVHGISAGGGLAAALTLLTRDRGGLPITFQYLDIPELDDRRASISMERFTDTPGWNTPNAAISWQHYLGPLYESEEIPIYAAPARANDLSGLPPAYIAALEYDPLRSEAVAYAEALFNSGVSVELHVFSGAYHLAYLIPNAQVEQRRREERIAVLRRSLHCV